MSIKTVNPRSYMGTRAGTPPDFKSYNRAPTVNDYKDYTISDIWHLKGSENVWMLTKKDAGVATWTAFVGLGDFSSLIIDPGDFTIIDGDIHVTHGDVYIHEGALQLGGINYTSTLRTLSDGTVYGLADVAAPAASEGEIYHVNSSGAVQWGNLTSTGGTVTITTSINGVNLEAVGGVAAGSFTTDDLNVAAPTAGGNLFVAGGDNINTAGDVANTVTINLDKSIYQPETSSDGTEGAYYLDDDIFMHAYGIENTFLGPDAGNLTLTSAQESVGIGAEVLWCLTTGSSNTSVGYQSSTEIYSGSSNCGFGDKSLFLLETGDENCGFGDLSLAGIVTGSNNTALGSQAGTAHTLADSSNIDIGHTGVAGSSNTIRIGTDGSGSGEQDTTYIAGVYQVKPAASEIVTIDANGQLGSNTYANIAGLEINEQTGTVYQLVEADAGKLITFENAAAVTLTIPADATFDFDVGTQIILMQRGAGTVTLVAAATVTILSPGGRLSLYEQYSNGALIKLAAGVWWFCGDLS